MKAFVIAALLLWCRLAAAATLTVEPVIANTPIVVQWTGSTTPRDWIGIYNQGAGDANFQSWFYTNGVATGSGLFAGRAAGTYDVRMFANDGWARLASAQAIVGGGAPPPPPPPPTTNCLSTAAALVHCFDGNELNGIEPRGILEDVVDSTMHSAHLGAYRAFGSRAAKQAMPDGAGIGALIFHGYDGAKYLNGGYFLLKSDGWAAPDRMGTTWALAFRDYNAGVFEGMFIRGRVSQYTSLEFPYDVRISAPKIVFPRIAPPIKSYLCILPSGEVVAQLGACN